MKRIQRVQTGLRIERRVLKVLKGWPSISTSPSRSWWRPLALHAFEGKAPFSPETIRKIAQLKTVYDLDLTAADSTRCRKEIAMTD